MTNREEFEIVVQCGITSYLIGEPELEDPKYEIGHELSCARTKEEFWFYTVFINSYVCAKQDCIPQRFKVA